MSDQLRHAAQLALDWMTTLGEGTETERAIKFATALFTLRGALEEAEKEAQREPWKCSCGANLYIDANGAPRSRVERSQGKPELQLVGHSH